MKQIWFCPLCEINLVNTIDHFIPQTDYPLFAKKLDTFMRIVQ